MSREDVVKMAREAGWTDYSLMHPVELQRLEAFYALVAAEKEQQMIRDGWRQCAKGQRTTQYCGLLEAAVKAEREKVAQWMMHRAFATGDGDTVEDLLDELEWQIAERALIRAARIIEAQDVDPAFKARMAAAVRAAGEEK